MNDEVFENVCSEIEQSKEGLIAICKSFNSSASAFYDFMDNEKDVAEKQRKTERYVRARERQAEFLFDLQREVVFKRDEDHTPFTGGNVVQRDKLIAETIKWQAGKLKPKTYGDKLDITTQGEKITNNPIDLTNLSDEELEFLERIKSKSNKG